MKMIRKKNVNPKERVTIHHQQQERSQRQKKKIKTKRKTKSISSSKIKRRKVSFSSAIKQIGKRVVDQKPTTFGEAILVALREAQHLKKGAKKPPNRIVKIPKKGGILPLIPIFAGLSALGALSGGAGIVKAVNDAKSAKQQLQKSQRHNKMIEAVALGKGMLLKPYKTGMGLFLKPYTN
ncbi:unnamed protein product [Acanthoscelides obtectus]|uniref:Uncharacterized protein n=1 Tax=Acanthoscelides obtectus TaxID=200917 RepID=A0A9P0LGA1_ACAOB|nr:unnamed protein product [Acanthoscelides obtectus]CAK1625960.1 hypothetical protein AOBTE_LOCUS3501 [Acanthoscelides obtectus]